MAPSGDRRNANKINEKGPGSIKCLTFHSTRTSAIKPRSRLIQTLAVKVMATDPFDVKHFVDRATGKTYRRYTYKRRPCTRVQIQSRLSDQLAGYTLIEKDLRNVLVWLAEIESRHNEGPLRDGESYANGADRANYTMVKGLFVASLTFYGKCFSKCEGRPVKLERAQLDASYHRLHDECISYRHNFAAHSGAKKLEHVEIALVYPVKHSDKVPFKLYRELHQPDLFWPKQGQISLTQLVEHVRSKVLDKIERLAQKVTDEDIIKKAKALWGEP